MEDFFICTGLIQLNVVKDNGQLYLVKHVYVVDKVLF